LSEERLEIVIDRTDDVREVIITPIGARWQGYTA
jgi:tRNA threonylcarbamoyladenosine biosynthesis protein TsaE